MIKEDIIRGLEGAMSKGESLERAMYSFYNAGYNKEDVEAAAYALSIHLSQHDSRVPMDVSQINISLPSPVAKKPMEISAKEIPHYESPSEIKSNIPMPVVKTPIEISAKEIPKPQMPEREKVEEIIPKATLKPMAQEIRREIRKAYPQQKPKSVQVVSAYEPEEKSTIRTALIVILSIILVVLLSSLASIFIFRESLLSFFNNLF